MDRYYSMKRTELKELAESRGLQKAYAFRKDALISWLQEQDASNAANRASDAVSHTSNAANRTSKRTRTSSESESTKSASASKEQTKASASPAAGRKRAAGKKKTHSLTSKKKAASEQETAERTASEKATAEKTTAEKPLAKKRTSRKKAAPAKAKATGADNRVTATSSAAKHQAAPAEVSAEAASTTPAMQSEIATEEATIQEDTAAVATMESFGEAAADGNGKKPRRELPADTGVLEVMSDGYGFLRGEKEDGTRADYYVPAVQIKRFNLKSGDIIEGIVGDAHDKDKYAPIIYINAINGTSPTSYVRRMEFDELTPIYPDQRLRLETVPEGISNRIVDLVAPVGRGQRGLIVSPPKAGKTTLLKSIAQAIELSYPEVYLFILLIDERPEEVTDFEQSVNRMRKGDDTMRTEVVASTFDKQAQNHTRTAEELLDRAKRLVESGQDVMILLDSLTRLSRAYNITTTPSGRTLSGGLDPVALYPPKKFFGAARNIRDAGSLTILATCLKDTGSRMDDMIYEEFKGTGNMEVHLSRNLSEMRIFPAIDIFSSGTRREDLLLTQEEQNAMVEVRKQGRNADETAVMEQFVRLMKNTETNEEFCRVILGNSAAASAASSGRRRVSPATRRLAARESGGVSHVVTATERGEE
ncbi:transcription termination factor Rho [Murdochiella vaginalis]|uniref:transcription termination factor Rho n=1 Tax=Murdochiella vaginalis TaxID=1852373 RepID=UPI000ACA5C1D|nr:transcription termination factor Rho [Murdochiella vaginalis]